ncbi:MAG: CARDB domain-containing protein [Nanoarchaeota archaeon]
MKKLCLVLLAIVLLALFSSVADAGINAPDLIVRKVIVYPTSAVNVVYVPADGSFVKVGFTFMVANYGTMTAQKSGTKVTLILPNGSKQDFGVYRTNALAPLQSYMWPINNPAPGQIINFAMAGTNTLLVCADALNQVQEGQEGNNCAKAFFNVKVK